MLCKSGKKDFRHLLRDGVNMDYKVDWGNLVNQAHDYAVEALVRNYHDEYIRYYNEFLESVKSDFSAIISRDLQSKIVNADGTMTTPLPKSWYKK